MLGKLWGFVRPVLFWEYRRGSWQYDVIVVVILAFIFLTPRSVFNDQPQSPNVREVKTLGAEQYTQVFLMEPGAIEGMEGEEMMSAFQEMLRRRTGRDLQVVETRPTSNEQGEVTAYLVYTRP